MNSILTSIKKLLGITSEDTSFDDDIIMNINSTFMILRQLGVGPVEGFSISDNTTTWTDYLEDISKLELVKTYIYKKVRLMFDPPQSGIAVEALKNEIAEYEWRLNVEVDPKPKESE